MPKSRDDARRNAPLTVLTLDRAVSLQDYEDFSRTFAGIAKAQAVWVWNGRKRAVFITVAGAGRRGPRRKRRRGRSAESGAARTTAILMSLLRLRIFARRYFKPTAR